MAYRFTDTNKWKDSWFVSLKPLEKLLFLYLCDNCDSAGFIELIPKKFAMELSCTENEILGACKGLTRGLIFSQDNDVILVRNFIKHQKNLPLNESNNAHKGIFSRFDNYKHKFENLKLTSTGLEILGANKGLTSPIGKGKDKGSGKGSSKWEPDFENLPIEYKEDLKKWWDYKVQIKSTYVSAGWDALVKTAIRDFTPLEFKHAVERSMANGWKGVFSEKSDKPNLSLTSKSLPKADDYGTTHF